MKLPEPVLSQVAAALVAALVAFESINEEGNRLIDISVFDPILLLVVATSIPGLILAERLARKLHSLHGE